MKRFFLLAISLFLSIGASNAFGASILVSQTVGVDGYGGSAWSNMTSALDSATGNNVSVVSNFENLNLMLTYDALWLDIRGRGINDPCDLLSAVEVANLISFINTGKRIVMIGEWGNIISEPHFVEDWDIQILSIVGGTFVGTPDEALTAIMYPVISHDLTNGISQIDLTGNAIGVAMGGTSLFDYNFATLWGNNVLTILDNGIFGDYFWNHADNSIFATNVANWICNSNSVPTIDGIIDFFNNGVADGLIEGRGRRPWLANTRLWIFGQMLESVKWRLENDKTKQACKKLKRVEGRSDENRRPPDFIIGEGVPELASMISGLMCNLECKGCPIKYTAIINYYKEVEGEEERSWIEIQLVDEDGNPMAHEKYELHLPDGSIIEGKLDENGIARASGVEPGTADITFPDLDTDSWERI